MKKRKLTYQFHNPNTAEATADMLLKVLIVLNSFLISISCSTFCAHSYILAPEWINQPYVTIAFEWVTKEDWDKKSRQYIEALKK